MMKISQKDPFGWFLMNYGVGGVENYDQESMHEVLKAVKMIFENTGAVELSWLGKFFMKLSEKPVLIQKFLNEMKEYGY
jgi:truncated hemoglobin YjbI